MHGRFAVLVISMAVASALAVATAQARPRIKTSTEYYSISGKTGIELIQQMNRKGPRHGFLRKAVAQTRYSVRPSADFKYVKGSCRTKNVVVNMTITYIYPRITNRISGKLKARWAYFMKDTKRHEQKHGRIAREMAAVLDRKLTRFSMEDRPGCRRAVRQYRREIQAIYDEYNGRQKDFDAREHRRGGPVEKSFVVLARK